MPDDIAKYKLDTALGGKAKDIVRIGDFVTYRTSPKTLCGDAVCGKTFDDRAGVTCLIELAKRLQGKTLPCRVVFLISDAEELGLRGAKTATFKISPDEAIAIDVSFGDGPDISLGDCGKLGFGGMIGISPTLNSAISKKLIETAKKNDIRYQTEVMCSNTSTNADVISVTKEGVLTGLISIPLRNMHTDIETVDLKDLEAVCDLLEAYILNGGVTGA
jgi:endoglucanase